MSETTGRTLIIVALIGVAGTLGAALIGNFDKLASNGSSGVNAAAEPALPPESGSTPTAAATTAMVGPHAPPIQINQSYLMWGEDTRQLKLEPGQTTTLKAMELYAHWSAYPGSSCAGPGFVPYTWQVRQPWPKGGDIEIRSVIKQGGGATEQVALGSVGRLMMGYCEEHILKNNDVEPVTLEIRYASAADVEGIDTVVDAAADAPAPAEKM
jgi:hypothetical protein